MCSFSIYCQFSKCVNFTEPTNNIPPVALYPCQCLSKVLWTNTKRQHLWKYFNWNTHFNFSNVMVTVLYLLAYQVHQHLSENFVLTWQRKNEQALLCISSYQDTNLIYPIKSGSNFMTSFNLNYLHTEPVVKYSHTGGWGLNIWILGQHKHSVHKRWGQDSHYMSMKSPFLISTFHCLFTFVFLQLQRSAHYWLNSGVPAWKFLPYVRPIIILVYCQNRWYLLCSDKVYFVD